MRFLNLMFGSVILVSRMEEHGDKYRSIVERIWSLSEIINMVLLVLGLMSFWTHQLLCAKRFDATSASDFLCFPFHLSSSQQVSLFKKECLGLTCFLTIDMVLLFIIFLQNERLMDCRWNEGVHRNDLAREGEMGGGS